MSSNPDQHPLKDWRSLGNNVIWRSDGAIVYPLFQPPRTRAPVPWSTGPLEPPEPLAPPKGPWIAMHPTGGLLGRFPTTETAVRAVDARHPLVVDHDYAPTPKLQKLLGLLKDDPEMLRGLAMTLPALTRTVIGPWEMSPAFGGSLIRQTSMPAEVHAVVAPAESLGDYNKPHEGGTSFPTHGSVRWKVWDGRFWIKGSTEDTLEAMDAADATLERLPMFLVEGRPTADRWQVSHGSRVRKVWLDPSRTHHPRGHRLCEVRKLDKQWVFLVHPEARRTNEGTRGMVKTRREAKELVDSVLRNEGWTLR